MADMVAFSMAKARESLKETSDIVGDPELLASLKLSQQQARNGDRTRLSAVLAE